MIKACEECSNVKVQRFNDYFALWKMMKVVEDILNK